MSFVDRISRTIGSKVLIDDADERSLHGTDLSPIDRSSAPDVVVRIRSVADAQAVVRVAGETHTPLIPRGGGMSYTGGYQTDSNDAVLIDLSALDNIREISLDNRYVTVEAGCTWQKLGKALEGSGMRTVLRGPISGAVSTIGGAVSQNLPGSMDGVLGLEVVAPDGLLVHTGSWAGEGKLPFYRNFGPDLTGPFLGDGGAFGLKTAVALRLEAIPGHAAHASLGFRSMNDTVNAMRQIAQLDLKGRVFGLDPIKNRTATKVGMREGLKTLIDVARTGSSARGLRNAIKIALAGQKAYDAVSWSLHLTYEGVTRRAADDALAAASRVIRGAVPLEPSIPVAMYASPFSVRGFLGLRGERWVPIHGVFPLGAANNATGAIQDFFAERTEQLSELGITHSFMVSANGPYFLVEPMFYWPDARLPLHERHLDARRLGKMEVFADNREARRYIIECRIALRELFARYGAVSAQLGRFYPYRDALEPDSRDMFDRLKNALDPKSIFNPGVLGTSNRGRES